MTKNSSGIFYATGYQCCIFGKEGKRPWSRKEAIICLEGLGKQFQTTNGTVTTLDDSNLEILEGRDFWNYRSVRCRKEYAGPVYQLSGDTDGGTVIFEGQNLSMMKEAEIRRKPDSRWG